ncbi:MAG: hypothetical protein JSS83_23455 [Cyanobacteria bacterium SZAS LIN-3]|nr:hypothetical protein [Cyanobacteria bacterium SZAS LIN-3]
MPRQNKTFAALITGLLLTAQIAAYACATCGCSEVCPLTAMDSEGGPKSTLLSESIWGNIILKMAYARDPEILRLNSKLKKFNLGYSTSLAGIAAGTMGQSIVSMATLNPPEGVIDSYAPGSVGLGLGSGLLVILAGGPIITHHYNKKLKARQTEIKQKVETILQRLEYSRENIPVDAEKELAEIVGERGARECVQLWQSSHQLAVTAAPRISSAEDKGELR